MKDTLNEITILTYSIQDSFHDLDRHVDETGKVILEATHKDFAAMRVYLSRLRGMIEGDELAKKQRGKNGKSQNR